MFDAIALALEDPFQPGGDLCLPSVDQLAQSSTR